MSDADRLGHRKRYVNAVITNYLRLPGTPLRASRSDRTLAAELYDQGVPIRTVYAAFVLVGVRHSQRGPTQYRLDPIRTLYYFLGAIDEATHTDPPLDPRYIDYLAEKMRSCVEEKEALLRSRSKLVRPSLATRGHNSALPRVR